VTEREYKAYQLQKEADTLFAACLQFLISKDERFLAEIRDRSQKLLDEGYETSFQHKRKALVVRSLFTQLTIKLTEPQAAELDYVAPRLTDLEGLSSGDVHIATNAESQLTVGRALEGREETLN